MEKFTYEELKNLIEVSKTEGYSFEKFGFNGNTKHIILRHDVDFSLSAALKMSEFENKLGISSTYFILVSSDFYNVFSMDNKRIIRSIQDYGHTIGLHFDETVYLDSGLDSLRKYIDFECSILSSIIGININVISMHRPSKKMLELNLNLDNIVNTYSNKYFKEYKYISDSRFHWREDVLSVVTNGKHDRIQLLTHPFSYNEEFEKVKVKLKNFIMSASNERYIIVNNNFRNLEEYVLEKDIEVKKW